MTTDQTFFVLSTISSVVFAALYFKSLHDMKMLKQVQKEESAHDSLWREFDHLTDRIDNMEIRLNDCCSQSVCPCPVNKQGSISY